MVLSYSELPLLRSDKKELALFSSSLSFVRFISMFLTSKRVLLVIHRAVVIAKHVTVLNRKFTPSIKIRVLEKLKQRVEIVSPFIEKFIMKAFYYNLNFDDDITPLCVSNFKPT